MNYKFKLICISVILFFSIIIIFITVNNTSMHVAVQVNPYNEFLGSTDYGNVVKEGPYGNASSPVKIAIIVGVHPWEYVAHDMAMEYIQNHSKSLKYSYYIYRVNVTEGVDDYETGRMNGQLLANKYVVPDIVNHDYQFVVDIHSNKGAADYYSVAWFINVPTEDNLSSNYANQIQSSVPGLVQYDPPDPTSPTYVTIPIIKNGTPAIIYESYEYDDPVTEQYRMGEVLSMVDNLSITFKYPLKNLV